jgi:hypothetical protein
MAAAEGVPAPLPIEQLTGGFMASAPAPQPVDVLTGGIGAMPVPMVSMMTPVGGRVFRRIQIDDRACC